MARVEIPFVIQNTAGDAVNGATVHVYARATTTHVNVFSAESGGGTVGQPLTTTSNGRVNGWVDEYQSLDLNVSGSGLTTYTQPWEAVRADTLDDPIAANRVVTASITDGSITTPKVADGNITTAKIADGNITAIKMAAASVSLTFRISHTFAVGGGIAVPNTYIDFIPPFFVPKATNQTVKLIAARHQIRAGTSATCKLQKNGSDITGFTGISVTTTATTTDPADVTLAADDKIALVVTAISGSPDGLSFTLYFEHVVTN